MFKWPFWHTSSRETPKMSTILSESRISPFSAAISYHFLYPVHRLRATLRKPLWVTVEQPLQWTQWRSDSHLCSANPVSFVIFAAGTHHPLRHQALKYCDAFMGEVKSETHRFRFFLLPGTTSFLVSAVAILSSSIGHAPKALFLRNRYVEFCMSFAWT